MQRRSFLIIVLAAVTAAGCRTAPTTGGTEPTAAQTITEAQIQGSSAANAWEVLRLLGRNLNVLEDAGGRPARILHRGRNTISLKDEMLLVIDGTEAGDFRVLQQIKAKDIGRIRVLTGAHATTSFGMRAASGVIVVDTKREAVRG